LISSLFGDADASVPVRPVGDHSRRARARRNAE
jgi:hypothetical protein